ncbi:cytochrome B6 [Paracoccus sp. S-4012]|uniref:cytochrome B6 n=1 Tax=Paracoccus sp. S-4012 TaxID=2665648 RepID=UPI0012B0BC48|nr:cytochrome B6 [Paracoccus sp. S-4012]MRX51286.1 cytochrome B6 [Paracoccus sp. S-4012]
MSRVVTAALSSALALATATPLASDPLPPTTNFRQLPTMPFSRVMELDAAQKPAVMQRQLDMLEARYDLADRPMDGVMMTGGLRAVQDGVRVRLPEGQTWDSLAAMTPAEIRDADLLPDGFKPLPHVKQANSGQVFPQFVIDEIDRQEGRDLTRFDVDFDLPAHLLPEFPPPIFLTTQPHLGDVSRGQLLTLANHYEIMNGLLTPVQMEGLRILLTPFPQEEFNQTEDRKTAEQHRGIACLDCHSNFSTNAGFHHTPDVRPQAARFRLDSPALRGMFNQQIHGSKRSLRSIEDFTEFEQHTAYFNGDHVSAARKGEHVPDRSHKVAFMAQMQNIIDFPPAPKLDPLGRLDADLATEQELLGEQVFNGKGQCAVCHIPQTAFMDQQMHDLKLERFYAPGEVVNDFVLLPDGPVKTFTLRGIKDTPPYLHDGRLMTLADTVEFFNLVLHTQLTQDEKDALVAYMLTL